MSEQNTQPTADIIAAPVQAAEPAAQASPEVASNPVDVSQPAAAEPSLILGKFKSSDDLAKAYGELEGLLGKRFNEMKPEDAAILKELQGIPKSASEYKIPDGVPEDIGNWFKEQAAKVGLTKNGALELMSAYQDKMKAENESFAAKFEEQRQKNLEELKKEFGSAFEQRVAMANKAVEKFGGQELFKVLGEAGLGTDPVVIKTFANLGKMLQEDSIPESRHGASFGVTPAEAERELNRLKADPNFSMSLVDRKHPDNAKNKERYAQLVAAATQA